MTKRIISMLLILTMLITTVPTAAFAETPTAEEQSSVDTGEVTLEGTNSFGTLLTDDITEQQEQLEEQAQSGYTVTGLEFDGSTATVTYDSLEEATLVVALYTEDGMQLITSGTTTVQPEETTATVTIEGDMPQYFMASSYLLDTYDMSPLCPAYDTPLYTQEMQELLASTVDDYDADRVLNLDDDPTTNFAVYAEGTTVIEYAEGVNTVTSADDSTLTYVIENVDQQITTLQAGNVFAYPHGENELLIVKVAAITVDGTTATITGAELQMGEAFSHVKIDGTGETSDMLVDDSTAAEGVTYVGLSEEENVSPVATFALDGNVPASISHEFKFDIEEKEETENLDVSLSVKGSLKFSVNVGLYYYLAFQNSYIEFKTDLSATAGIYIKGSIEGKLPLGSIGIYVAPGVYVGFEPKLVLKFTGTVDFTATLSARVGIKYDDQTGVQNISTAPEFDIDFKIQGKLFIGIDLGPKVKIVSDDIASFEVSATVGVELTARACGEVYDIELDMTPDSHHECEECLDLDATFNATLSGELRFLDKDWLSIPFTIGNFTFPLGDMYYSVDNDEFGLGKCPAFTYRVTLTVVDERLTSVGGASIITDTGEEWGVTNSHGVLVVYVPQGSYTITATYQELFANRPITVSGATKEEITLLASGSDSTTNEDSFWGILDSLNPSDHWDVGNSNFVTVYCDAPDSWDGCRVYWWCGNNSPIEWPGVGMIKGTDDIWYYPVPKDATNVIFNHNGIQSPDLIMPTDDKVQYDYVNMMWTVYGGTPIPPIEIEYFLRGNMNNWRVDNPMIPNGDGTHSVTMYLEAGTYQYKAGTMDWTKALPSSMDATVVVSAACEVTFVANTKDGTITATGTHVDVGASFPINVSSVNVAGSEGLFIDAWDFSANQMTSVYDVYSITLTNISAGTYDYKFVANGNWDLSWGAGCETVSGEVYDAYLNGQNNTLVVEKDDSTVELTLDLTNMDQFTGEGAKCKAVVNNPVVTPDVPEIVEEGNCGEYVNWSLDSDGLLRLWGTGSMFDYLESNAPWYSVRNQIITVIIESGVTSIGSYGFNECEYLSEITIPDSVKLIGVGAFQRCSSLLEVSIPEGIACVDVFSFYGCSSLNNVNIPGSVTSIERYAFEHCGNLTNITIPGNVISIGESAFYCCRNLNTIIFSGSAPTVGDIAFCDVTATVYYPADNTTWTSDAMQNYGGTLTWVAYTPEVTTTEAETLNSSQELLLEEEVTVEIERLDAVYGGEYGSETSDTYANIKTATFTDLVPGEDYVLLALVSLETEAPLGADNLLFIDQGTATEDGTLEFKYVQRVDTPLSYVMACGASNKDLADATITFPDMVPDGETQVVDPEVVYDGETLEEGRDYVILGDVDFTEAGTYTCYIRGIYEYTGLVECTYHVIVTPTMMLSYPTLSFEDEINYNVYYTVDDISSVTEMGLMLLSSNDAEATIDDAIGTVPGYVTNGTLYLVKTEGIAAANMGDTVYFKVYAKLTDGTYAYSGAGGYNAKAYAGTVLSGDYTNEMKALVVAMVNYGTEAQTYFGHNTDKLVNSALTGEQKALVSPYDESMMDPVVSADSAKTSDFVRVSSNFSALYPSVSFDGAFSINFYCTPTITVDSGMTLYYWDSETYNAITEFSVDNATGSMEMTETNGQYWGNVPGIAAKEMDKTYYVSCVFQSEGETITTGIIAYSLGKYCEGKAATDGDAQQAFAQATAVYGYYAKQYFASIA